MLGAANALGLKVIIQAVDEATGTIGAIEKSTKKLDLSFAGLAKTAAIAGAAIVGAFVGVGVAVMKMGERADQINDVRESFDWLAQTVKETGDSLLSSMREASGGMISNFDLMSVGADMLRMHVAKTAPELNEIVTIATRLAHSMGKEAAPAVEALTDALARGSARAGDLGLSIVNVRARAEQYKAADASLSEQMANSRAIWDEARATVAAFGDTMFAVGDPIDKAAISWQNFKDTVATTALPLANSIATALSDILERFQPAITGMLTGFFEMLKAVGGVVKDTMRAILVAMGVDMDTLGTDAKTWGENVIIMFAQGMANAFVWVVNVLNDLGNLIASWLEPGSPPKILPEIDKWGRDTIQAYLDGMGEGINYDEAGKALKGIERFFEMQMRPLSERLAAIGHERADIGDTKELARLQRRMGFGFANPQQERLAQLRIEEIQAEMRLRDLEAERGGAVTKAGDILFPLQQQVALMQALAAATGDTAAGIKGIIEGYQNVGNAVPKDLLLPTPSEEWRAKMAAIFDPLKQALGSLVGTWAGVFGGGVASGPWIAGMEQEAPVAGAGKLQVIMVAGLNAMMDAMVTFWNQTLGPTLEGRLNEWLIAMPKRVWAKVFTAIGTNQEDVVTGYRKLFGDITLVTTENGPALEESMLGPWKGWHDTVTRWIEETKQAFWSLLSMLGFDVTTTNPNAAIGPAPGAGGSSPLPPIVPPVLGPEVPAGFYPQQPPVDWLGHEEQTATVSNFNLTIHTNAPVEPIIADFNMMRLFA